VGPEHPLYIVSKGRAATPFTSRSLDAMGVRHFVVVERNEVQAYRATLPASATVLALDPHYQTTYDTFDSLGATKSKGPGPARNFAWEHSIASGAAWHWVMDDNIDGFHRLYRNIKTPTRSGGIFRAMEAFCDRFVNVSMAGPNYFMFASRKSRMPPFVLNTRIYSCNLIRNAVPFRWRGRYNEDTDLSLRMLKARWVTVQFNAFLQFKLTTQTVAGGCNADFYAREGTLPKSRMLARMHPDVARVAMRWGRVHHVVDYRRFKGNRLRLRPGVELREGIDNFGMELRMLDEQEAKT
jgi:hypothetical protein